MVSMLYNMEEMLGTFEILTYDMELLWLLSGQC